MSNAAYPTPDNILSITYQLMQDITDPLLVRGQMPCLSIQFEDTGGIVRTKMVSFGEMLPYLQMLKKRSDELGLVLLSNPESTFDKKVSITYGESPYEPGLPADTIFQLDAADLPADSLAIMANCTFDEDTSTLTITDRNFPAFFTMEFPVVNIDNLNSFLADYSIGSYTTALNGKFAIGQINTVDNTFIMFCSIYNPGGDLDDVTITSKTFITVTNSSAITTIFLTASLNPEKMTRALLGGGTCKVLKANSTYLFSTLGEKEYSDLRYQFFLDGVGIGAAAIPPSTGILPQPGTPYNRLVITE